MTRQAPASRASPTQEGWCKFTLTEVVNRAKAWEAAMLTKAKVVEAQSADEQLHHSGSGAMASHGRNQHGARHYGDRDRATDRRHSSSGGCVGIADQRKDTVESSVQQTSQVWSALKALDGIILLGCAEVGRIFSRKPIKGDVSPLTRASSSHIQIMQCRQRSRAVVMIFTNLPWASQSTLCHHDQLLLSCLPRYPFRCLAILSVGVKVLIFVRTRFASYLESCVLFVSFTFEVCFKKIALEEEEQHCDFKLALTLKSRPCRGTLHVLIRQIAA